MKKLSISLLLLILLSPRLFADNPSFYDLTNVIVSIALTPSNTIAGSNIVFSITKQTITNYLDSNWLPTNGVTTNFYFSTNRNLTISSTGGGGGSGPTNLSGMTFSNVTLVAASISGSGNGLIITNYANLTNNNTFSGNNTFTSAITTPAITTGGGTALQLYSNTSIQLGTGSAYWWIVDSTGDFYPYQSGFSGSIGLPSVKVPAIYATNLVTASIYSKLHTNGFTIFTDNTNTLPPVDTNHVWIATATNSQGSLFVSSNGVWIKK